MRHSLEVGASFGLTSGVITTLGLIVGLYAGTQSKLAVVGGVVTIAVADALSDALGIHISEESENTHTPKEIWVATLATFVTKFVIALTFLGPILLMDLESAVITSVVWGAVALAALSYWVAVAQQVRPWMVIGEHLAVAAAVVIVSHYLGAFVARVFG